MTNDYRNLLAQKVMEKFNMNIVEALDYLKDVISLSMVYGNFDLANKAEKIMVTVEHNYM